MSMRIKAALVIVLIFLAASVANYFSSVVFTTRSITETMEQELYLALDIADTVVATKIGLLKSNAETVAERLLWSGSAEGMKEIMAAQMEEFSDFSALTVYDRYGVYAASGELSAYDVFTNEKEYIRSALVGRKILTSPHYDGMTRDLVMHVFVPIGTDMVLSATVSGMLFSDLLSQYRLWQTGSIFIVDAKGTFVANYRYDLVTGQRNFVTESQTDPDLVSAGDFYRKIISTMETDTGRYIYEGEERLCVYKYVTNSIVGWRIGVVAPLSESPQSSVKTSLLFAATLFLAIGVILSIFVSRVAVKPFVKIEKMMDAIERRDNLLNTGNNTAELLLSVEDEVNVESSLLASMALVGESADVDRVQIWCNEVVDGSLHFIHKYQWLSEYGKRSAPVPIGLKFSYADKPEWERMFMRGDCINGPVSMLTPVDRAFLETYDMKTIVIIPLFLRDCFWGFFSIDDCREERTFTPDEIRILRSVSLMMVNAINRSAQTAIINEANEYTELLIEAVPLSCTLWDKNLNLFKCNEGSVRLFEGRDKSDFIENFGDFSPEYQPDGSLSSEKTLTVIKKALAEGMFVTEWMHQKRDGTLIPAEVTLVRVTHGSEFVVAAYVRDLREQKRMIDEINDIMLNLQSANAAKSAFLAKMSHEMRTPLNAIIGLSELALDDETVNEEARLNIEKVNNAGETLLHTVNDILDISKIEAGRLELIPVKYDMPSLINDTITQSSLHIDEKPIEFILDIDEDLPLQLYGDDLRIKQIFNNLLSNAFKYTKEGTVEFGIRCERMVEAGSGGAEPGSAGVVGGARLGSGGAGVGGGARLGGSAGRSPESVWLTVWVKDTGIGIKPENFQMLFEEFVKVDEQTNRQIMGTGLGLPITKKLVEMMGGTVTVESEYGKGSTFRAGLIQGFVTDATIGSELVERLQSFSYTEHRRRSNSSMVRIKLPYARVLVVDDTLTNLDVAKGLMKPYGMTIDCVTSGQQAIDAVSDESVRYDAIFMDHMMPGMDGLEATKRIRDIGSRYAESVPVIACTANAISGSHEFFLSNGFQAFLSKPIDIARLDEIIRNWIRDKEKERQYFGRETVVDGDVVPDIRSGSERRIVSSRRSGLDRRVFGKLFDEINVNKGIERFGGDKDVFIGILRSFALNTKPLIDSIREPGVDNLSEYAIIVHGIKGSSRGIFAEEAGDKAEGLELAAKSGDAGYIAENNRGFIEVLERLISGIESALSIIDECGDKPLKDAPDMDLLKKLAIACDNYDMDSVDEAMAEIESYSYDSDDGLAAWLSESAARMEFAQIAAKLAELLGEGS